MTQPIGGRNRYFDWPTIAVYLSLVTIGWFMLYSIFYNPAEPYDFINPATNIGKQTIWVGLALIAFVLVLSIEWTFWNTLAYPIYAISITLLVLVLIFGSVIKGARSWFAFGGVSFQPSEIAKFGTALALSSYMSFKKHDFGNKRTLMITLGIFLLPIFLILLQSDAGSAIVFLSFFLLLYRKGFSPLFFFLAFIIISIFILTFLLGSNIVLVLLWYGAFMLMLFNYKMDIKSVGVLILSLLTSFVFNNRGVFIGVWLVPLIGAMVMMFLHFKERNIRLIAMTGISLVFSLIFMFSIEYGFNNYLKPHQQDRINAWLQPEKCDRSGSLYNIIQSKLAIGSGGTMGKGFLEGEMTKLKYVPEQSTDFIFSTVGEEQGFIGVFGVIILFTILISRLIIMAERARLEFIRNYLYCIAGILFVHFFINIGMTMGVMPVIGIPLPFMSKGGSSLLSFTVMLAVAIKMDYYRFR